MAESSNFTLYLNTAPVLRFALTTPEPINGWDTLFTLSETLASNALLSIVGTVANANDVPNALHVGVFDVPISLANTTLLHPRAYVYSFRRTNPSFEDLLAYGIVEVVKKR